MIDSHYKAFKWNNILSRLNYERAPIRTPLRISAPSRLAFTRYSFTLRHLCTNQPSLYCIPPLALPTIVQYYCTAIGQHTTPHGHPLRVSYTIQYWQWQYRVKANLPLTFSSSVHGRWRRCWWPLSVVYLYYKYRARTSAKEGYTEMCSWREI